MPIYSFDRVPKEIRELLGRCRHEQRSPEEVRKELARLGVSQALQMLYLRDGLGLSLKEAKRAVSSGEDFDQAALEELFRIIREEATDDTAG